MGALGEYLTGLGRWSVIDLDAVVPLIVLGLILLLIDLPQHQADDEFVHLRLPVTARGLRAGAAVILLIFSGGGLDVPFIYFQF